MLGAFKARLCWESFKDGEIAELRRVGETAGTGVDVPSQLLERLESIARAYGLHLLRTRAPTGETLFNTVQARSWVDELEFVLDVVRDPALEGLIGLVHPFILSSLRASHASGVVIDRP